jgi:hypothetical protein
MHHRVLRGRNSLVCGLGLVEFDIGTAVNFGAYSEVSESEVEVSEDSVKPLPSAGGVACDGEDCGSVGRSTLIQSGQ